MYFTWSVSGYQLAVAWIVPVPIYPITPGFDRDTQHCLHRWRLAGMRCHHNDSR